jgi:transcriptional regulator with XRE-family HTH domain
MTGDGELVASKGRPVEARGILGRQLRAYRDACNLTITAAAARVGFSAAKLSRIEGGKIPVSDDDLCSLLELYGVADGQERYAVLTFNSRLDRGQWWDDYTAVLDSWFTSFLVVESMATESRSYESLYIPGLLQTQRYAEALIRLHGAPSDEIRRRVEVRVQRQQRVLQPGASRLWTIIGQAALHDAVVDGAVGPEVMREQIEFLLDLAHRRPDIQIQILPAAKRWLLPAESSFTLLRLPQPLSDHAYFEHIGHASFLGNPNQADRFNIAWARLAIEAQQRDETVGTLKEALARLADGSSRG